LTAVLTLRCFEQLLKTCFVENHLCLKDYHFRRKKEKIRNFQKNIENGFN